MTEQPEALRLADALDELDAQFSRPGLCGEAAIELRRLHEEVTEQSRILGISAERELSLLARIDRLEKQLGEAVWNYGEKVRVNQELLEALKYAEAGIADICDADREPGDDLAWCEKRAAEALPTVRAAIAKAKEQT